MGHHRATGGNSMNAQKAIQISLIVVAIIGPIVFVNFLINVFSSEDVTLEARLYASLLPFGIPFMGEYTPKMLGSLRRMVGYWMTIFLVAPLTIALSSGPVGVFVSTMLTGEVPLAFYMAPLFILLVGIPLASLIGWGMWMDGDEFNPRIGKKTLLVAGVLFVLSIVSVSRFLIAILG